MRTPSPELLPGAADLLCTAADRVPADAVLFAAAGDGCPCAECAGADRLALPVIQLPLAA